MGKAPYLEFCYQQSILSSPLLLDNTILPYLLTYSSVAKKRCRAMVSSEKYKNEGTESSSS